MLKDQAKDFMLDVGTNIVSMLWYEYGRPFLQAKLHQLCLRAIAYLESPSKNSPPITRQETKASKIIDADYVEIKEADDIENNEKIIRFLQKRVDYKSICNIMGRSPDWMPDILVRGDGYETKFYKKD